MLIIIALLLLAILAFYFIQLNWLEVEELSYYSQALPEAFDGFRIVQISDLHGKQFGRNNSKLLEEIRKLAPDMIAITGDFYDRNSDLETIPSLLVELQRIAPTYYVTGNHEWALAMRKKTVEILQLMNDYGITVLQNRYVLFERDGAEIAICGVDDPNAYADLSAPSALAQTLPEGVFSLLLAHRNDTPEEYLGFVLALVGHAHGGIIRFPGLTQLMESKKDWRLAYTSGFYTFEGGATMFVSRGLGVTPNMPLRVFNRPQLPLIVLHSGTAPTN